ncbi:MAG: flippase-like domain-containing protein [Verrucomicrobia bacterium]|nr:flippase-like domain-containing protein [Verrucomicrobiota bacterium]MCH8510101.1 flippase-like domain-containing protein [Kiritimatiellia bacterium]
MQPETPLPTDPVTTKTKAPKTLKSRLFSLFRFVFVVCLLGFLIQKIDLENLRGVVNNIEHHYFFLVFLLWGMEATVRAYNWGLLLRCKGVRVPFRQIFYAYITGSFFGYFVPSSFGTDVSRFIALSKQTTIRMADAAVSVVALNVVSLLSLAATVSISALVLMLYMDETLILALVSLGAFSGIVTFCLLFHYRNALKAKFPVKGKLAKPVGKFWSMVDAFSVFEQHYKLLTKVLGLTFVIQIIATLIVYSIALAVQSDIHILFIFLFMPIIAISRLIPLSIANLGAEQGIFVFLFALVGVPEAETFTISVLLSTSAMLFILFGGVVYLVCEPRIAASRRTG